MKIEFCDLKKQYFFLKEEIDEKIKEVLTSGKFIGGKWIEELENLLANYTGSKYAIGVSSGTDALLASLAALKIRNGDYIITTPFTFIANAETIFFLGAKTLFVDIDKRTFNIDPKEIEKILENPRDQISGEGIPRNKIKGIVAVDLFGQAAEYEKIHEIAKKHSLFVIEDGAQSFGAEYKNRKACSLGDISITSFFPSKPLGCFGDGGMVFTDSIETAQKIKLIRNHGQIEKYKHEELGLNLRLDSLQAAILISKFKIFVNDEIDSRKRVAKLYDSALYNLTECTVPFVEEFNKSIYAQYSILAEQRDKLKEYLESEGIPTAIHYPIPIYSQKACLRFGYAQNLCPTTEEISKRIISLPIDAYKTDEEISYICDKIRKFYKC